MLNIFIARRDASGAEKLILTAIFCKMETRISRVVCSQQGEKITCHLENLRQFSEQFNKLGEIMSQPV